MSQNFHEACKALQDGLDVVCINNFERIKLLDDEILVDERKTLTFDQFIAVYHDEQFQIENETGSLNRR